MTWYEKRSPNMQTQGTPKPSFAGIYRLHSYICIASLHNNVHFSSQAYDKCRSYAILCHCTEDKCIQKIRFLGCSPFFWSYSVGNFLFSNQFSHEFLSLLNVGRIIDDFLFQCLLAVLLHYHQYTNINYT